MRLPLIADLDSRDGSSNKDARLTNILAEADESAQYAAIRPGLSTAVTSSGNGNGLARFSGVVVSVFGTTLGVGTGPTSIGTVENKMVDFAQGPL